MKHTRLILFVATIIFTIAACNTTNHSFNKAFRSMTNAEKVIADSLILNALDHEAIYTLIDTLKPMSSIQFYRLPLLSNNTVQKDSAYQVLATLQNIANKLSVADWQFVLQPFERGDSIYKNIELYVFRKSKLQQKIEEQTTFYKTLGITSGASPATVLAITEYEQKYNRWRSYGYLFGYPEYAVDFFVNAGKSQDSTKQFVTRDFFAIPVFASTTGHFTYATPKSYKPNVLDSSLYYNAILSLAKYKRLRVKYVNDNKTNVFKLLKKCAKK
jgi:hypothetical protein